MTYNKKHTHLTKINTQLALEVLRESEHKLEQHKAKHAATVAALNELHQSRERGDDMGIATWLLNIKSGTLKEQADALEHQMSSAIRAAKSAHNHLMAGRA